MANSAEVSILYAHDIYVSNAKTFGGRKSMHFSYFFSEN